jgi:hypothetical protein
MILNLWLLFHRHRKHWWLQSWTAQP